MCSFTVFNENENICLQKDALSILLSVKEALDEDAELAYCILHGCLLARIREWGRYSFLYPFDLGGGDERAAVLAISEYAVREELPLVISDIPAERLGDTIRGFRHIDVDAADPLSESYSVAVKTECMLADTIPKAAFGRVSLGELQNSDAESYARLWRDRATNEFFGYDYRDDLGEIDDDAYFISMAREEFLRGVAMNFAVRAEGEFIGDAMLYAFDGRGMAHFALRLLPEARGLGYSHEVVGAIEEAARRLSLVGLFAECKRGNERSSALLSRRMEKTGERGGTLYFRLSLVGED